MPLESGEAVFDKFSTIPTAIRRGAGLEQFLFVKGSRANRVLLVAHADTYWDASNGRNKTGQEVTKQNGIIRNLKGGLGADDRAGCAMIWLLKEMGHSILITNGEECRRKGANYLMNENHCCPR